MHKDCVHDACGYLKNVQWFSVRYYRIWNVDKYFILTHILYFSTKKAQKWIHHDLNIISSLVNVMSNDGILNFAKWTGKNATENKYAWCCIFAHAINWTRIYWFMNGILSNSIRFSFASFIASNYLKFYSDFKIRFGYFENRFHEIICGNGGGSGGGDDDDDDAVCYSILCWYTSLSQLFQQHSYTFAHTCTNSKYKQKLFNIVMRHEFEYAGKFYRLLFQVEVCLAIYIGY